MKQHMQALEHAQTVRRERAALMRQLKAGEVTFAEVVGYRPRALDRMTVYAVLCARHKWGPNQARRFLESADMSETRTVGALTKRERKRLADAKGWTL